MPHGETWISLFVPGYGWVQHYFQSFGKSFGFQHEVVVQHLAAILLVIVVMSLLSFSARAQLKAAGDDILPDLRLSARTIVELLMEGVLSVMSFGMSRPAALRHFWIVGTLGFFVLFSNLLGLLPGFLPPTESFNTTFACGTITFVYYNFYAFYRLGLGHLAHMANPVGEWWGWLLAPLFFPIELVSHCIRPCSLAIRLLCNIAGDHLVLGVFVGIFPLILPLPFMGLGLFVALVQSFIFVLLSSVYLGEVETIAEHHGGHGHGDHAGDHLESAPAGAH